MVTEHEFHKLRDRIEALDPSLSDRDFTDTLPGLLEVLGHPSPELRDNLGWSTLSRYFNGPFCPSPLRSKLLELLASDKFLFHDISTGETPASVKRSFSVLTIADILAGDAAHGSKLEAAQINSIVNKLCRYLEKENDTRGHDSQLGWVHALAHSGDAFWALVSHPSLNQIEMNQCLSSLLAAIDKRGASAFLWQEDYRLARAVSVVFEKLPENELVKLIKERYARSLLFSSPALQNILGTFRCVYLEMHWGSSKRNSLMEAIKEMIC